MKIFANKTNLYNNMEFLENTVKASKPLEGVGFNVAITKDNNFVIFSPVLNNQTTILTIANKNLNELASLDLLTLDYVLKFYDEYNTTLKIFLNLLPSSIPINSEESLNALKDINRNYAVNFLEIINKYPNLNLYIGSVNSSLVQLLKGKSLKHKLGIVLFGGNLNYIDVDFYVFGTGFLNDEIFKQQLNLGKEVMLYVGTSNDMYITYEYFRGEKSTALAQNIFNDIYFLNDYPVLFIKLFS